MASTFTYTFFQYLVNLLGDPAMDQEKHVELAPTGHYFAFLGILIAFLGPSMGGLAASTISL